MSHELFRKTVKWVGILILAHLAAMILFAIIVAGSAESVAKDSPADAYGMVLTFDLIFYAIFVIFIGKLETSYAEYYRNLKNAMKEEGFSLIGYYKQNFLKEQLVKAAAMSVFHLPFAVFYQLLGFSLTATTTFEQFYILDAGFYGVAGSSILGFLLCTLVTAVIFLGVKILLYVIDCYQQKKDLITY